TSLNPRSSADKSDADLVNRFAALRDEAAFTQIVQRHGPLVLSVCRRVLSNAADADDAFQEDHGHRACLGCRVAGNHTAQAGQMTETMRILASLVAMLLA